MDWGREIGDDTSRRDPPDLAGGPLGEPEVAVVPGYDEERVAIGRGNGKLGYGSGGRHPADPIVVVFDKPQCAVGSEGEPPGCAASGDRELGQHTRGRDPANPVPQQLRKPEVPVVVRRQTRRPGARERHWKPGDDSGRGDPPNLAAIKLAEPEIPVGAGDDREGANALIQAAQGILRDDLARTAAAERAPAAKIEQIR